MVAFVAVATALAWWECRVRVPMIEPRFFRSAPFSGAIVISLIGMGGTAGYLWVMTFYLQDARGLTPAGVGVLMLPIAVMVVLAAPASGRIAARRGARLPLVLSGTGIAVSALLLTGLDVRTPTVVVVLSFVAFGLGFGMLNAPITNAAVAGMPPGQAAVASAVASTGRQVGQAVGVAVIGAIVVHRVDAGAVAATLPAAAQLGWWVIAVAGALVVVIAVAATSRRAMRTAETTREHREEPVVVG